MFVLISIAVGPIFFSNIWHNHYGKITFSFSIITIFSSLLTQGWYHTAHICTHSIVVDFLPFILMIAVLFVITGGINVVSTYKATL